MIPRALTCCLPVMVFAQLAAGGDLAFPDALDRAAIQVERLDSILDHALLIGNGDINALVWSENGRTSLMLTRNDVWDARLDSKLDPPVPTLAATQPVV